jgi:hypothetical protein
MWRIPPTLRFERTTPPAPAKLTLKQLLEAERFAQLKTEKKHFLDTIKLIAYRAESALVGEVREALARDDESYCQMLCAKSRRIRDR